MLLVGQAGTADAQFWQSLQFRPAPQNRAEPQIRQDNRSRPDSKARQSTRAAKSKKDTPIKHPFGDTMPKGPLQLMVSIGDQRAVLYSNGIRVAETKISTGVPQKSDSNRNLQHHPEESLASLEHLQQRADVLHAPPDVVGHRVA